MPLDKTVNQCDGLTGRFLAGGHYVHQQGTVIEQAQKFEF